MRLSSTRSGHCQVDRAMVIAQKRQSSDCGCFLSCLACSRCWAAVYTPANHTCQLLYKRVNVCTTYSDGSNCLAEAGDGPQLVANRLSESDSGG
ncbi:hypothetical protein FJT64_014950 [Amphibalanus amphitrite]|uniref:Uncharacterized protein n=1 Tax=Amphibalanus amphitrite TaxID=1232801 RepID=A0A6A4X8K7_AMPAM|nr:hypothetical protein FJT64_014950 [Amphibalanus amphitrite]